MLLGDEFDDMFEFHGSMFNLYPVYSDLCFTMSPEHLKLVLATDFTNFAKGAVLKRIYPRTCNYFLFR
jgi:hypothetical protein